MVSGNREWRYRIHGSRTSDCEASQIWIWLDGDAHYFNEPAACWGSGSGWWIKVGVDEWLAGMASVVNVFWWRGRWRAWRRRWSAIAVLAENEVLHFVRGPLRKQNPMPTTLWQVLLHSKLLQGSGSSPPLHQRLLCHHSLQEIDELQFLNYLKSTCFLFFSFLFFFFSFQSLFCLLVCYSLCLGTCVLLFYLLHLLIIVFMSLITIMCTEFLLHVFFS